jgi:FAD/FMN-containing dehydrogenase
MNAHQSYFKKLLGEQGVLTDRLSLSDYANDRSKTPHSIAALVLLPSTTQHVSEILNYCTKHSLHIVPSGGRTGLSGAAKASEQEIILSLARMNKLINIDSIGATVEVEAGCVLQTLQEAVQSSGLHFPIDFAAKGSAMVGGIVSTNAGGIHVTRYGMTRNQVLGLEVVLMDGTILDLNKKLLKDNSGYDLKHFFIGSEGTLGLITKVTFQCVPIPKESFITLIAISQLSTIPIVLKLLRQQLVDLVAFEFLSQKCLNIVLEHQKQLKRPFDEESMYYLVIEGILEIEEQLLHLLEVVMETEHVDDAIVASSDIEKATIWKYREDISESLSYFDKLYKNDIAVPVGQLTNFLPNLETLFATKYAHLMLYSFGHIADGNVHINVVDLSPKTKADFLSEVKTLEADLYRLVDQCGGTISAEHGIGLLKKETLHYRRSNLEIELMKKIKTVFDPNHLLNSGKIF